MEKNYSDCPLEYALEILGGKWKLKIIWTIFKFKVIRFNQLKRELPGITDLMLAKILKLLVENNIVQRTQFNEIPPRVEYSLTENGLQLVESLANIRQWVSEQNQPSK